MPDLLPPNATPQERALSLAVDRLPTVPLKTLWTPQTCPEAQLPWLAWALSVDEWDAAWPVETKRQVIADSIEQHRKKGTVGALRRALQRLGYEVEIDEATGVAYTFKLRVRIRAGDSAGGAIAEDALNRAVNVALRQKNTRSALTDTLYVAETDATGLFIGGLTMSGLSYEAKQEENFIPAPTSISFTQTGVNLAAFTWSGAGEYYAIEVRRIDDDSLILTTVSFSASITDLSVPEGLFYISIRSAMGGLFSSAAAQNFAITILPPFNVVASNDSEPAFLRVSFNCFGDTFVTELCAINNEWTTDVQSSGGTPVGGVGTVFYTGIMSGFYDLRLKAVYSFGDSEWVEVRNIEVLPFP
jgi:phage tail P2-like protein